MVEDNQPYWKRYFDDAADGEAEDFYQAIKGRLAAERREEIINAENTVSDADIAEGMLNAAIAFAHELLGIESGDVAGQFFSGNDGELVLDVFSRFIRAETVGEDM